MTQSAPETAPKTRARRLPQAPSAIAFALSWLLLLPAIAAGAWFGGWWILLIPLLGFGLPSVLDEVLPLNHDNPPLPKGQEKHGWTAHSVVVALWPFLQFAMLVAALWVATRTGRLSGWESFFLFVAIGTVTSAVGIVHAHELIHKQGRFERFLGDALLAMVLYGHFRTEHIHVHHRYVGTPRDAVTARLGESYYAFLARVLPGCVASAWSVERERLERRGRPVWHHTNPFWIYAGLQIFFLAVAVLVGGWQGLMLWIVQAFIAILYLEAVNYIEHYGLMRREIAPGRYEPVALHHSWNSAHRFTNYFLINLARHPDHHYRPDRDYQLLQSYAGSKAPQMPHPYPIMVSLAFFPGLWRKIMDKRVTTWLETNLPRLHEEAAARSKANSSGGPGGIPGPAPQAG